MSSITIAALLGGGLIAIIVLIYFSQYRRRTQEARQREINQLTDRHRQFRLLATAVPPQYISPEVKALLGQRAIEMLGRLAALDRADLVQDQIEEWKTYIENARKPIADGAKSQVNEAAVTEIRRLLKVLYRFIESQIRKGKLDKAAGQVNLEQTQFHIGKVLADAHVAKARQAIKAERYRVAIHHYHDAVTAFAALPNNALAQKSVQMYRAQIKELEKQATAALQAKNQTVVASTDTRLSAKLDEMVGKEDTWKKKQAYDD